MQVREKKIVSHLCPLCSSPLLCQIRNGKISWFCRSCYQEIPFALAGNLTNTNKNTELVLTKTKEKEIPRQSQEIEPVVSLNFKDNIRTIVLGIRQFLQCDRVLVCQLKENGKIQTIEESLALGNKTMAKASIGHFFSCQELENFSQGKIQIIEDLPGESSSILNAFFEIKAKLIVPILLSYLNDQKYHRLWGMLIVHQCKKPRQWQESEIGFMSLMASQIALSIQQNKLQDKLTKINRNLSNIISMYDVTKVANQRYFRGYLEQQWQEMLGSNLSFSLIICSVDNLKQNENDDLKVDDDYLQKIAQAICKAVKRRKDLVARYHSENFIILLPATDYGGGLYVAKLIQEEIYSLQIKSTVSLGFSCLTPHPGISCHKLIELAEEALNKAKNEGGDRIISGTFETGVLPSKKELKKPANNLRQNIQDNQEILKSYLAYFISRGKDIISPTKGKIVYRDIVYEYQGYHQKFDHFWRQLLGRSDFAQLYIEGDLRSFQDFLVGIYNVRECARCNLPIPVPSGAAYEPPSCHLCEHKHCALENSCHHQIKSNVVVIGKPPTNIYSWQNLLALNNFSVTFVSEAETVDLHPIEEPIEMILIDRDINRNIAEYWAKELGKQPKFNKIPIIALSQTAGNGLPWLERNLEIEDYLLVPLNGENLVKNLPQKANPLYWFPA